MKKIYTPNLGETAKLITSKISDNLQGNLKKKKPTYRRIEKFKSGSFNQADLKYLVAGCDFLRIVGDMGIDAAMKYFTTGDKELNTKTVKAIMLLKAGAGPIYEFLSMYRNNIYAKYSLQRDIANLENMYEIIDKSRDGVITKKQEIEDSKGKKTEIEITMSESEIAGIVKDYTDQLYRIQDNAFRNYLGLGMSIVSLLGGIFYESKNSKEIAKKIGIGGLVSIGTFLGRKYVTKDYGKKVGEKARLSRRQQNDIINNEPSSFAEENERINDIKSGICKVHDEEQKIENKVNVMRAIDIICLALLTGTVGIDKLKESERIDSKSISQILVELNQNNFLIRNMIDNISGIFKLYHEKSKLNELEEQLENIVKQIEEKQDPLVEMNEPFEKMEIKNFNGKFYQERNPKTGKIGYRHKIDIPEFSMQKGEVVLLSGKSGRGKSTFLKLLKRGDIHNRNAITIDGNQVVDKLGKQFIAIKADKDLGSNTNVLKELVGKEAISDIDEEEKQKLQNVLQDVQLDTEGILEELETKDYSQFSTGQKKRLVLAQLLYRASERPSVILVDEPVGNVEDDLIDNQLKAITQVIKNIGAMGIIVTHRVDLAKRYVDKHYHIGEDGVMREFKKSEREIEV